MPSAATGSGTGNTRHGATPPTPALAAPNGPQTSTASVETLEALLARFGVLLRRFEEQARRDGLHDDGPMTRITELLHLCMATLCEVTSRNVQTTERHAAQVIGAIEEARKGAQAATDQARAEIASHAANRATWLVESISGPVAERLNPILEQRINQVPLRTALRVGAALLVAGFAVGWIGRDWRGYDTKTLEATTRAETRTATMETVLAGVRDTKDDLAAILFRDGLPGARHWLDLMRWNHIQSSLDQCENDKTLLIVDVSGRKWCQVPLWITPPNSRDAAAESPSASSVPPQPQPQQQPARQPPPPDNRNLLGLEPPRPGPPRFRP